MLKIDEDFLAINKQLFCIKEIKLIAVKRTGKQFKLVCVEGNEEITIATTTNLKRIIFALNKIIRYLHKHNYLNFAILKREIVNMDKIDSVYYEYDESLDKYYVSVDFGDNVSILYRQNYIETQETINEYKQQYYKYNSLQNL